jgi:hypothetical protein
MPDPAPAPPGVRTLAEFLHWLGDVPAERIMIRPGAGHANVNDVLRIERQENRLCELVCGVLVERPLGYKEAAVAAALLNALEQHVTPKRLGVVTGPEGSYRLGDYTVRLPAVAFCASGSYPGDATPGQAAPEVIPRLVAEVVDGGVNAELNRKLEDYFAAGVKLVWIADLATRSVIAYTSPTKSSKISASGTLDPGRVVPGFKLPVKALFEHMGFGKKKK